jgi:hypothetical protein
MKPTISFIEHDNGEFELFEQATKNLQEAQVYVGIAEQDTTRENIAVTNAGLLFIHTNGSEVMGIPPRPVIEPAIDADRARLEKMLASAAKSIMTGNHEAAKKKLALVGRAAATDAKKWFKDPNNNWPPNRYETVRRKLDKISDKQTHKRVLKKLFEAKTAFDAGDFGLAFGIFNELDTPLIDTASMRKAINYFVGYLGLGPNLQQQNDDEGEQDAV